MFYVTVWSQTLQNYKLVSFFMCWTCSFHSHQQAPDYRLYKSEPELTTVTEVDESNGEDRSEYPSEHSGNKGTLDDNFSKLNNAASETAVLE